MLKRLLCKLVGHAWDPITHMKVDGYTAKFCRREQQWIEVFPGWHAIHKHMDT